LDLTDIGRYRYSRV